MIVPQFELATRLGLVEQAVGADPLLRGVGHSLFHVYDQGFMENIPNEITEATYIDGASVMTVYLHIALPLAAPPSRRSAFSTS
jgi:multiple sugar transport system permease protein